MKKKASTQVKNVGMDIGQWTWKIKSINIKVDFFCY